MADLTRKTANLFDPNSTRYHMGKGENNVIAAVSNGAMFYIEATPNTQYSIKVYTNDSTFVRLYLSNAPIVQDVVTTYNEISESETTTNPTVSITNTNYSYLWIQVGGTWYTNHGGTSLMLNTGNQALPLEPYGWVHSLRKLTTATEAVENPLYSDGTAITAYTIKGNTVQDDTPTPSNPVAVNGVGERTGNLLNPEGSWTDFNCSHSVSGGNITVTGLWFSYLAFTAKPNTTYGMKYNDVLNQHVAVYKNSVSGSPLATTYTDFIKFTTDTDTQLYIVFYANIGGTERTVEYKNVRLYEGDYTSQTIPDYEPYGYKIPILTTQGSAVNYLGSVQSTRQIHKIVLDGTEIWSNTTDSVFISKDNFPDLPILSQSALYCTHFPNDTTGMVNGGSWWLRTYGYTDLATWRQYLYTQIAAGTPVTVWYVLATPTTGIVNEPLMKIDDYSDSISNAATIPTTDGANSITVDTTVQPSEFSATWTGWHDSSVKEYDGTDWQ